MRIFIVEDSEPVKRRLRTTISEIAGIEVVGDADTEWEAIQGILATRPDAVIVDIQLREGSGMNVLQDIKRRDGAVKVIVLTNYVYPQYRERCLRAGADHFLDKSGDFTVVEKVLASLYEPSERVTGAN
jgi:DNA-binding NarL/FixJ family response regulator